MPTHTSSIAAELGSPVDPTGLALALAVCVATLVAVVVGVLARHGGAHTANATIKGGAAFGGTLALAVAVLIPLGLLAPLGQRSPMDPTGLALALAVCVATLVAVVAGVLARHGGAHTANATIKGGAAFGGTLALAVAVLIPLGLL